MLMYDGPLDWQDVERARRGAAIGNRVVYRAATPSTNLLARELSQQGALDGTVIVCDDQTQGRGRLGRQWVVPPRSGVTVSIIKRPAPSFPLFALAPAAALAVADTLAPYARSTLSLKWPNDVLLSNKKVAGILIELEQANECWTAIIGIGINVNAAPDLPTATCLAAVTGARLAREPLLIGLLCALERHIELSSESPAAVLARWRGLLTTLGLDIHAQTPRGDIRGRAVDVDEHGALLIRDHCGVIHVVHAGDVTLTAHSHGDRAAE